MRPNEMDAFHCLTDVLMTNLCCRRPFAPSPSRDGLRTTGESTTDPVAKDRHRQTRCHRVARATSSALSPRFIGTDPSRRSTWPGSPPLAWISLNEPRSHRNAPPGEGREGRPRQPRRHSSRTRTTTTRRTPINTEAWRTREAYNVLMKLVPYKRIGEPEDIGRVAVWLASTSRTT